MFWHLDGSSMDNDFAFDIWHRTREDWEAEQRKWEEHNRRFDAEWAERTRLGVTDSRLSEGANSVWSRSISVGDAQDVPVGIRVFGVGCRLAELIAELRAGASRETTTPETQGHIDRLNRAFGNLREILQGTDPTLSEALLGPVVQRFAETLDVVAGARPELEPRCLSLSDELERLLDPPPPQGKWQPGDLDVPF
jgi:hypothetical protein